MNDHRALMRILSAPRPNGSGGERQARQSLKSWLESQRIPFQVHFFRQTPYFFECIGVWIIISRTILAAAVWLRWGWWALLIALLGMPGGLLDMALHIPLVTWPGIRQGENLVIPLDPAGVVDREVLLSAHYDSKTELLDHHGRMFFLRNLPAGISLTVIAGGLAALEAVLRQSASPYDGLVYWTAAILTLPLLVLAWGLGLNLSAGRLLTQSQGAVDNGAACAILLGLAARLSTSGKLHAGAAPLQRTRVTVALFSGEEINFQGSRPYAAQRSYPLPAVAVNLEAMGQDGSYVTWQEDGSLFRRYPTSAALSSLVCNAVRSVTGEAAQPAGPMLSDGGSFIAAGLPVVVLGSYDRKLMDSGFHRPADHLGRVVIERLPEGVAILERLLHDLDSLPAEGFPR